MNWCFRFLAERNMVRHGVLSLPDELMHRHDETVGDELAREFMHVLCEPISEEQ